MHYDFDFISIGSGSAGRRIAVALKRMDWKTAIIEKDVLGHFGGTCIRSGCIPTKSMVEKSLKTDNVTDIINFRDKIVERIGSGTLRNVEERVKVDVIRGQATFLDNHTLLVDGKEYSSDIIVIATGSKPLIPPIKGLREVDFITSKELLQYNDVPKRMLIIGGGRIGLEFGALYNRLGAEVTVFEGMDQLLPGEDNEVAESIRYHLIKSGIKIFKGRFVDEVQQIENNGSKEFVVSLEDGNNAGNYKGDLLLVSTGRIPNTSDLKLENTGVELDRAAVKVNEFMQSSQPNIFAIGDAIGNPMFTNWASFQSGKLLENLKKSRVDSSLWEPLKMPNVPRICFIEPELAATGMTEEEAREKYNDDVVTYNFMNKWLGKSMIVDDWDGYLKGVGRKGSNEILGVSLWGKRAGSLVQMIVFAMDNGLGWKELADGVYGHPVLIEGILSLASNMKGKVGS